MSVEGVTFSNFYYLQFLFVLLYAYILSFDTYNIFIKYKEKLNLSSFLHTKT